MKQFSFLIIFLFLAVFMVAQNEPQPQGQPAEQPILTESSEPDDIMLFDDKGTPNNEFLKRNIISEREILEYPTINESDVFWQKYLWGIIDVREKINQTFSSPHSPFFKLMIDAVAKGSIVAYKEQDFEEAYTESDIKAKIFKTETTYVTDPETYEQKAVEVQSEMDYNAVKKFKIKEVWFFDKKRSRMRVQIIGIAPLEEKTSDDGSVKYDEPLFWIYWPDARHYFARQKVYMAGNDATTLSWDDFIEMRFFNYYITKESNARDIAIENIPSFSGDDPRSQRLRMLHSKNIKEDIFNFEHDLWSY